jgi:hypothetical protein
MRVRIVSFALIFLSALFLPFWFFLCACIVYGFFYSPYELMIIGLLIDAQFGGTGDISMYTYTLSLIILSVVLFILKPYLLISQK